MKNITMNSCLADFENELENLNHSEMKELVGGDYGYIGNIGGGGFTCGYPMASVPSGNFGGYNSFSDFASAYGLTSPSSSSYSGLNSGSYSGSGSAPTTTPQPKEAHPEIPRDMMWCGIVPNYYLLR